MPAYATDVFYVSIDSNEKLKSHREEIEEYLQDEDITDYEFQDDCLIVNDIYGEDKAQGIDLKILNIIGGGGS